MAGRRWLLGWLSLLVVLAPWTRAEVRLTVLHTNDWHSRLLPYGPNGEYTADRLGDDTTVGGCARAATILRARRTAAEKQGVVLTVDGGDFSMGTLFSTVARQHAFELCLLGRMGFTATTLGNHEFEVRPQGLAAMLRAARSTGGPVPLVLSANTRFAPDDEGDDGLERLREEGALPRWTIIQRGGLSIGLVGLIGRRAWEVAKDTHPVQWLDPIETARQAVEQLQAEGARVVVALSHSGVYRSEGGRWLGEDMQLAREVPGLDIIVSGHSHQAVEEPIVAGEGTIIVQAGSEGRYVGELVTEFPAEGRGRVLSYRLHSVDDTVAACAGIASELERAKDVIARRVLAPRGLRFDDPVVETSRDWGRQFDDVVLANLVTDSLRRATGADIAFTGNGTIRDSLHMGSRGILAVSDIFRVAPLGLGVFDDEPGYPLMKLYATGQDLKSMVEVFLLAYTFRSPSYYPRISGARITYNTARVPFDRVVDIEVGSPEKGYRPVDLSGRDGRLYALGCTSFVGKFLWAVERLSYGLLTATPRFEDGRPIDSPRRAIIDGQPDVAGVQEVKEWVALIDHLRGLPDRNGNGVADIPPDGPVHEPRLVAISSWSPSLLVRNASYLMWTALGLIALSVGVFALLCRWLWRRLRKAPAR